MSTQGAGTFGHLTARELAAAMVSPKRCGGLDYDYQGADSKGAPHEELIAHYKRRIIEFEKFKGPISEQMVRHLKLKIDRIRATHGDARAEAPHVR